MPQLIHHRTVCVLKDRTHVAYHVLRVDREQSCMGRDSYVR